MGWWPPEWDEIDAMLSSYSLPLGPPDAQIELVLMQLFQEQPYKLAVLDDEVAAG